MSALGISSPERWQRVKAIVAEVMDAPPNERGAVLERASGADPALRRDAEALLEAMHETAAPLAASALQYSASSQADSGARVALDSALSGRYVIESELGRGGMATVFLARDARNARHVAIKALDPALGAALGSERFLSEVRVTASLTHPNILPLFDSGDANGLLYYVAPYIEGASLRARLEHDRQLPVNEAVRITREVADALDYAHRHGFVHRDVKPENILLCDGHAIVADFGIARAVGRAARGGEAALTATGIRLGTPAYMSPEQTVGEGELDGRSDEYALGCVLYEMMAGVPPYVGPTPESILRQHVVSPAPSVTQLRPDVPPWLARALTRAMAKTPADRYATVAEFGAALRLAEDVEAIFESAEGKSTVRRRAAWRSWRGVGLFAVVCLAGGIGAGLFARTIGVSRERAPSASVLLEVSLPPEATPISWVGPSVALSPDGSLIAYLAGGTTARHSIYIRSLGNTLPRRLSGTEGARCPTFSPDGRWILFTTPDRDRPDFNGRLTKVAVDGGEPIALADSASLCGIWTDRGEILFSHLGKLLRVSSAGGAVSVVARRDTGRGISQMEPAGTLPGGNAVLVWLVPIAKSMCQLAVVTLPEGRITRLTPRVHQALEAVRYANGHLLYHQGPSLLARPFSLRTLQFTGPEVAVMPSALDFDVSESGILVWLSQRRRLSLVTVTEAGVMRTLAGGIGASGSPLGPAVLDSSPFGFPRLSPDGKRVALEVTTRGWDIWVYEIASRTLSRVTTGSSGIRPSAWTADGREVLFIALDSSNTFEGPARLAARPWNGGPSREVMRLPPWEGGAPPRGWAGRPAYVPTVSIGPAHSYAVFPVGDYKQGMEIWLAPLDTPLAARALVASGPNDESPALTLDGKWLAFVGSATGQPEVYLRRVRGKESREQVSEGGAMEPAWSSDGRNLFYRSRGWIWRARIDTGASPLVVRRDSLFPDTFAQMGNATNYDVFPGGRALLMIRQQTDTVRMGFATEWPALLRQRRSRQ